MGFDVNAQANNNDTSLCLAIKYFNPNRGGNIITLTYLLTQKNINVNTKTTLLHYACQQINYLPLDIFKLLIETHGADVNAQNTDNDTPLHKAVLRFGLNDGGKIPVLTYLLAQNNVNVNIRGQCGHTLLHTACLNIDRLPLEIFKFLIETMGYDVNAQNNDNDTPLHYALQHGLGYFNPNNGDDINVLTYLINQKNVNVNIRGEHGYTLLHTACETINILALDIFKLLIETLGCDVNAQDENKDTPIHLAFLHFNSYNDCSKTILTYLLSHKSINFNIKGQNHRTLFHWASICGIAPDSDDDYSSDDDLDDSDDDLNDFDDSDNSVRAEGDTLFSQIVGIIAERCIEQILDETRF
jgi:ankyrin repeat protein